MLHKELFKFSIVAKCTMGHEIKDHLVSVIPEALPKRFVSLKPIKTAKHKIIKIQLTSGI